MKANGNTDGRQSLVLAVDDNQDSLYALERILRNNDYSVVTASSGDEALKKAKDSLPDIVLLDVMMPLMDGYEVLKEIKRDSELKFSPVILVTAKDSLKDIVFGLEQGADGYITKPFKPEELLARTAAALRLRAIYRELRASLQENRYLAEKLEDKFSFKKIIGSSSKMQEVFNLVEKVADTDATVLITGPSGSGKEVIARAIHYNSNRKAKQLIIKNCAAFSEQLLESELFGHLKGAFTGATSDKVGLFEAADGGTFFLDEVGEMSTVLQAKLLRVIQEGTFIPVGSTKEKRVDVRILAATNRDLQKMVDEGTFREDLFYRLNIITLELPALSERAEDIPDLIDSFLRSGAEESGEQVKTLSEEAFQILCSYQWRGNIRELENEISRMLILGRDEDTLGRKLISPRILRDESVLGDKPYKNENSSSEKNASITLKSAVESVERDLIQRTLIRLSWNKSNAAKELGISRSSLIQKVKDYNLTP